MNLFKLVSSISVKNMVGFTSTKRLFCYPSPIQILNEFYGIRLEYYQKRKDYLMSKLERDMAVLTNKERFIL